MSLTLKLPIKFPFFAPATGPNLTNEPTQQRPSTEVRFARWGNKNAERFEQRRRAQEEIEAEIRRTRRFDAIANITNTATSESSSATAAVETFKSTGTRSSPSRPSIPGRKSKYSKPPPPPKPSPNSHPALKFSNIANSTTTRFPLPPENMTICEDGVSYVIDGAPFEFKYSYTETPTVKPIRMREPAFVPFGPATMPRPWTGRAPRQPGHKKGLEPVLSPGPFSPGSGPMYVKSSEEIWGEPLTKDEITELVGATMKATRQLNIGRDGLTHNMLENIHAHWKRKKVCKIKCKGVCTVDMDNVCQQLEERTGGKIIYRKGGAVYLFRGRNYSYKMRPHFPLMLWKPVPPVYPRLIKQVPEGLTLAKATEMRQKGRNLIPICKLAKNGVYSGLVRKVREAFEECELVRINCQGLNESDYRRIGAKLRDLVPCILLSFKDEHILMWRGQNWRSSLPTLRDDSEEANKIDVESENSDSLPSDAQESSAPCLQKNSVEHRCNESHNTSISSSSIDASLPNVEVPYPTENSNLPVSLVTDAASLPMRAYEVESLKDVTGSSGEPQPCDSASQSVTVLGISDNSDNGKVDPHADKLLDGSRADISQASRSAAPCTEGVLFLLKQAVEEGSAIVLDDESLDDDHIYQTTETFARSAPSGPVFKLPKKVMVMDQKRDKQEDLTLETKEIATVPMQDKKEKSSRIKRKGNFDKRGRNVVPQETLGVDELARLLT